MMIRFISSKGVLRPQGRSAQFAIRSHELGASLVEYALLVALIAVVAIVAVRSVGTSTSKQAIIAGCRIDTTDNPTGFTQCCEDQGLQASDCLMTQTPGG